MTRFLTALLPILCLAGPAWAGAIGGGQTLRVRWDVHGRSAPSSVTTTAAGTAGARK
jgi:hypothetical protein